MESLQEWLNDDASDYSVARNVLSKYHPLEPEMWLHLADGRLFPQCIYGGSISAIITPWPGMETVPTFVKQYEECTWRGEKMTLLEYLRKANQKGEIIDWIKHLGLPGICFVTCICFTGNLFSRIVPIR